jgi:hypothetical protein
LAVLGGFQTRQCALPTLVGTGKRGFDIIVLRLQLPSVMGLTSLLQLLPGGQTLAQAKDKLLSDGLRQHFNRRFQSIGSMLNLKIDTQKRIISVTIDLKGESAPLAVEISDYGITDEGNQTFLELDGTKVQTSREWLNTLLRGQHQRIPLPKDAARFIKLLA